jgi:hypothetical protein
LRAVLANAGVAKPPILGGLHIAMRLQHNKLAAVNLSTDGPDRRCDGRDGAPIYCFRSAAQSTTARSMPDLGIDLTKSEMQT